MSFHAPDDAMQPNGLQRFVENNTGLILIICSQAFFAVVNVPVKLLHSLDPPVSTFQLVWVRMVITYLCGLVYMIVAKIPDPILGPKGIRLLLLLRGFSGFVGLFAIYFSLQYLSLADATALTFLTPLCTSAAAAYFLGELLTWRQVLAGVISLCGVMLIARPPFLFGNGEQSDTNSAERIFAVGISLIGVLGATSAYTTIRAIGKRAHTMHILGSFSSICVIASSIGMYIAGTPVVFPPGFKGLIMLAVIGFCGFFAQVLLVAGLQREMASRGTMAIYTQIVFASILQYMFFGTKPSPLSVLGTAIIICAALYVALMKPTDRTTSPERRPLLGDNPRRPGS